ncbi:MAG: histidinol-phosphate transaminase [Deltaproteobacteria bacterium]|nr:histidinol-phosphate transaminase [Deltaproteobacteria bacterium]
MIKAKPSVRRLSPYINGHHNQELINNHRKVLKLDSNESTIGPSPRVIGTVMQYLQEGPLNWYPDIDSTALRLKLAQYTGVPKNHILTFNGSDHALETIARTFLDAGDEVIYFQPTYDHFRVYAQSCNAHMVPVNEAPDASFIECMQQAITSRTKMVYLVNPNNPTGHTVSVDTVEAALIKYPEIIFIVDEAYYEFCEVTASSLAVTHDNIMITRSFSKAFGLAGFRCGYLMAHPSLCQQIKKIRVGKSINTLAQIAACAALDDLSYMRRYVDEVNTSKKWLINQLKKQGIPVKSTPANYILIRVQNPAGILNYLESQNIHTRDRSKIPELKGMIRITIGDQLAMKRFWKKFQTIPKEWLSTEAGSDDKNIEKKI